MLNVIWSVIKNSIIIYFVKYLNATLSWRNLVLWQVHGRSLRVQARHLAQGDLQKDAERTSAHRICIDMCYLGMESHGSAAVPRMGTLRVAQTWATHLVVQETEGQRPSDWPSSTWIHSPSWYLLLLIDESHDILLQFYSYTLTIIIPLKTIDIKSNNILGTFNPIKDMKRFVIKLSYSLEWKALINVWK